MRTRRLAILILAVLVAGSTGAAAAPSMRDCVEQNTPRYENPGSAVVAQYSDLDTLCRGIVADATASFTADTGTTGGTGGNASGSAGATHDEASPPGGQTNNPDAIAPTGAGARHADIPAVRRATSDPSSAAAVRAVAAAASPDRSGPLGAPLSGTPTWLLVVAGVSCAAIAGAAIVRLRRGRGG